MDIIMTWRITMSEVNVLWYEIDQVWQILGFKNRRAAIRSIRVGTFPLPTFELAGRKVVDVEVAKSFFIRIQQKGLEQLEKRDD